MVLLTSLSAMAAETATFLIDMTKTRLQLHGESLSSARPASAFGIAADILRREGPLGLYKGLTPAIIRHLFYTPIRIVGYEHLRNAFVPNDRPLSLSGKALIGGVYGVIAQCLHRLGYIIDWGLLQRQSRNFCLRDKLSVSHRSVYFAATVLDILLRFACLQSVLYFNFRSLHGKTVSSIISCLEILCHGMWNFFRLENEHLNNVGRY